MAIDLDDKTLVRDVLAGKPGADNRLVLRFSADVQNHVRALLSLFGSDTSLEREDVIADVWEDLWRHLKDYEDSYGNYDFAKWFAWRRRRRVKSILRSMRAQQKNAEDHCRDEVRQQSEESCESEVSVKELLLRIMARLPRKEGQVLYLDMEYGLSTAEIARRVRISPNSVGPYLHRARKKAHKILSEELGNAGEALLILMFISLRMYKF